MGCSVAFGLPKITLYVAKLENLKGSSRPKGLFSCIWSAKNYFVRNKTGGFERLKQTKKAIFLHLVCRKLLCMQQNRRICKGRADQMGYFPAFGLLLNENVPESRRSAQKKNARCPWPCRPARIQSKSAPPCYRRSAISRVLLKQFWSLKIKQPSQLPRPWRMLQDR